MGGIADEDVEWAIVNRLKAMLDAPPKTKFNVTQTFALFSSVLLWSKNRSWVAGNHGERRDWQDPADHKAHDAREAQRGKMIFGAPWQLSRVAPRIILVDRAEDSPPQDQAINSDFENSSPARKAFGYTIFLVRSDTVQRTEVKKPTARGFFATSAFIKVGDLPSIVSA